MMEAEIDFINMYTALNMQDFYKIGQASCIN